MIIPRYFNDIHPPTTTTPFHNEYNIFYSKDLRKYIIDKLTDKNKPVSPEVYLVYTSLLHDLGENSL